MARVSLIILCWVLAINAQYSIIPNQVCKQRNQQVIKTLKSDNPLFSSIERNDTGNGIHHSWMDKMRSFNVKHAFAIVHFELDGRDVKLSLGSMSFYNRYYPFGEESRIKNTDNNKQSLSEDLRIPFFNEALRLIETHRIKNNKSCGKLYLQLLDDACLPVLYFTDSIILGEGSDCIIKGEEPIMIPTTKPQTDVISRPLFQIKKAIY